MFFHTPVPLAVTAGDATQVEPLGAGRALGRPRTPTAFLPGEAAACGSNDSARRPGPEAGKRARPAGLRRRGAPPACSPRRGRASTTASRKVTLLEAEPPTPGPRGEACAQGRRCGALFPPPRARGLAFRAPAVPLPSAVPVPVPVAKAASAHGPKWVEIWERGTNGRAREGLRLRSGHDRWRRRLRCWGGGRRGALSLRRAVSRRRRHRRRLSRRRREQNTENRGDKNGG